MHYRAELDGLRAVAIVPVVIYHLKIPIWNGTLLPGGFLGVDIFFVLSGFLITRLLVEELEAQGRVNLAKFYARRVRRIFPVLLLVILASIVSGVFLLHPTEMSRLLTSSLASLGFVSNAYWFLELKQYGAQSGLLQPLLHTWSLAIEEQFYLFLPILLLLLSPAKHPLWAVFGLVLLSIVSLLIAELTARIFTQNLSFFSPLSRAWELLTGSCLAIALHSFPNTMKYVGWPKKLIPKLAIGVIFLSISLVHLENWVHPGIVTIPVVIATAALICFACPSEPVTRFLSSPTLVMIGKLSFSIYLWHFPVFAFGRLSLSQPPTAGDMSLWLFITIILSALSYHFVERPFRFVISTRPFVICLSLAISVVGAFYVVGQKTDLLSSSIKRDLTALYGGPFFDNEALRDQSWSILNSLASDEIIGPENAHGPSDHEQNTLWFNAHESLKLLVIGNSHSKDMFNALHFALQDQPNHEVARFGIRSDFPQDQTKMLLQAKNYEAADIILVAPRYSNAGMARLPDIISQFLKDGKTVALIGNTTEFISPSDLPIYDYFVRLQNSLDNISLANHIAFGSQSIDVKKRNERLRVLASNLNIPYLSRRELICSRTERSCVLATPNGDKSMYDYGHWTIKGAEYFGSRIKELGWLEELLYFHQSEKNR